MTLILFAAAAAATMGIADPAAIDREIAAFVAAAPDGAGAGAGAAALPVDRRLRLRPCEGPLAIAWRLPRRDAVAVRCPDAGGWHLFVPMRAMPVAAAEAPPVIARGDAVTVLVAGDGFTVSRAGEALEPGAPGAWIKVRVDNAPGAAAEPLRAEVVRPGLVTIRMP